MAAGQPRRAAEGAGQPRTAQRQQRDPKPDRGRAAPGREARRERGQIPYQDRAQTVADAISSNVDRALEGEERDIAFQVLFDSPPSQTMGELFDRLDADGREMVNKARSELGLESVEEVEAHQAFEAANRSLPPSRDAEGRIFQSCHAANCQVFPLGEHGEPISVADRRWWCGQHRDQAGPDDHLPPEVEYVLDFATMSPKAVGAERSACSKRTASCRRRHANGRSASGPRASGWRSLRPSTRPR